MSRRKFLGSEVRLGTQVRIALRSPHQMTSGPAMFRASGVVCEIAPDALRVEVQTGNPLTEFKNENGEIWVGRHEVHPFQARQKTPRAVVLNRRATKRAWREGKLEAIAKNGQARF